MNGCRSCSISPVIILWLLQIYVAMGTIHFLNLEQCWINSLPFHHFCLAVVSESGKPLHSWFDTSAFSVKRLAKDVDELVKELGFVKTSIVAHDWGGCIAWEFAHDYGQSLEKVC